MCDKINETLFSFTFLIGVHCLIKTGSALAFFVNEGSKYSNVLEIFSFNKVFKYVNDLERVFFLASISLIYFVLKYVGNLPWVCKIRTDHVQILRILVQNSSQKNKCIFYVNSTDFILKILCKIKGQVDLVHTKNHPTSFVRWRKLFTIGGKKCILRLLWLYVLINNQIVRINWTI